MKTSAMTCFLIIAALVTSSLPETCKASETELLISRAQDVFRRVKATADKKASRPPSLKISPGPDIPWAEAQKDGTIVLSTKALDVCYQDVDKKDGDSRVAFILGHELAHLSNDHFWEIKDSRAFQSCKPELKDIFKKDREFHADSWGLVYASMAGYDPNVILNTKRNIFQEWLDQISERERSKRDSHPVPEERVDKLLKKAEHVKNKLHFFHLGVRLYQVGKYDDALRMLSQFRQEFPSREVLNNIGLILYQMGASECEPREAYQFKLSTLLDTRTQAEKFDRSKAEFRQKIEEAIEAFRKAGEQDPFYLPVYVNLSSAYIMQGRYSEAAAVLKRALKLRDDDPAALNNQAIVRYLSGKAGNFNQTLGDLINITKKNPGFSDAFYNLGRVMDEHGSGDRTAWKSFLNLEPAGIYAGMVRQALKIESKPEVNPPVLCDSVPVKLGNIDQSTEDYLDKLDPLRLEWKKLYGEYYSGEGVRILVMEDAVVLVEHTVKMDIAAMTYGKPYRKLTSYSDMETLVYDNCALDLEDKMITRVLHFEKDAL